MQIEKRFADKRLQAVNTGRYNVPRILQGESYKSFGLQFSLSLSLSFSYCCTISIEPNLQDNIILFGIYTGTDNRTEKIPTELYVCIASYTQKESHWHEKKQDFSCLVSHFDISCAREAAKKPLQFNKTLFFERLHFNYEEYFNLEEINFLQLDKSFFLMVKNRRNVDKS